jgi:hypothetical protein
VKKDKMKFYVLEQQPADYESSFRTDYLGKKEKYGDPCRCKVCGELTGPKVWLPPYKVELELYGKGFGDLVFFFAPDFLVSEHFKRGYEEYGLKGLHGFESVEVIRVKKHKRIKDKKPDYFHVTVAYSQTAIDDKLSGIERAEGPICSECGIGGIIKRSKGTIVRPTTWTGEDIFVAKGLPGIFLATEKFRSYCEEHKIRNAVLIRAEEYSYDFYPWEKTER